MVRTKVAVARFLDWLLGPRCHYCGIRVFPRDSVDHYTVCGRTW